MFVLNGFSPIVANQVPVIFDAMLSMMELKEDGIGVSDLLKLIPEDLLLDLAAETKVDYQVKKRYGRTVLNLELYGILDSERVGLRSLEDFYNAREIRAMFKLTGTMSDIIC